MLLTYLFSFIFGSIVGSFLNVVILRHNTGQSALAGRSACFSCGKMLHWYELIPMFSFLAQGGRCRGCRSRISTQYFWVELATGLLFLAISLKFDNFASLLYYWLVISLLIVITVYDLKHKIIPDRFALGFTILAFLRPLLFSTKSDFVQIVPELGNALLAGIILFAFFGALWLFSGGRWMGLGDAKLAFGLGLLLGWPASLNALVLSFWLGAIFGLSLILLSKISTFRRSPLRKRGVIRGVVSLKTEIPFAPFLFLGTLIILFSQLNFFVF